MNLRPNSSLRSAAALLLALSALSGCGDDDDDNGTGPTGEGLQLQLNGFPASTPAEGTLELWVSFAEGARHADAESMGKFRVNAQGNAVGLNGETDPFAQNDHTWQLALDAFITIEPADDVDPAPSLPGILAGNMLNRQATLTTDHADAIGNSFASASGSLVLATPSSSDTTDETEGIWFASASGTAPSLILPTLPAGWIYQAWASKEAYGQASLGRFALATGADDDGSGPLEGTGGRIDQPGYGFPGSDFPFDGARLSLTPGEAFITVEPANGADGEGPFMIGVLHAQWGVSNAGTPISLTNLSSSIPTASLSLPQE